MKRFQSNCNQLKEDQSITQFLSLKGSLIGNDKSPWSSRYCVGLLDVRPEFNMRIFLRRLLLSRFLAKTLRINRIKIE